MVSPVAIAGYLALFIVLGASFLFANLLLGRLLRPAAPNPEKLEVYECGEPTIGSSFVQFDLRFYVVALLFIIFDVELAFFFPWSTVYGKAVQLMDPNLADHAVAMAEADASLLGAPSVTADQRVVHTSAAAETYYNQALRAKHMELGIDPAHAPQVGPEGIAATEESVRSTATTLARLSIIDIGVFFAVLMVGFAYVWKRGDLDWVRAVSKERSGSSPALSPLQRDRRSAVAV